MVDQSVSKIEKKSFELFCIKYRQQQDTLQLVQQLNQMVKAVQRHRGMSMGLLGGSDLFKGDFSVLQIELERRLSSLEAFADLTGGILSPHDQECLHAAWHTIRADWQDDDVIDNFELHSHFVEQLQNMVTRLAKTLERPTSIVVLELMDAERGNSPIDRGDSSKWRNMIKRVELLNFAATYLPQLVEQIAKIRGLATFAASREFCDDHHESKLRYAIVCANTINKKVCRQVECLENILPGRLVSLLQMKTFDIKLTHLLNTVEMDILGNASITTNSQKLFFLATDIIDGYLTVVDEATWLVGRWLVEDFDDWLCMV